MPRGSLASTKTGADSRERLFSLEVTFWAFLFHMLSPACACREVLRKVQPGGQAGAWPNSPAAPALTAKRARLPLRVLARTLRRAGWDAGAPHPGGRALDRPAARKNPRRHDPLPARHACQPATQAAIRRAKAGLWFSAAALGGPVQPGQRRARRMGRSGRCGPQFRMKGEGRRGRSAAVRHPRSDRQ